MTVSKFRIYCNSVQCTINQGTKKAVSTFGDVISVTLCDASPQKF